MDSVRAQLEQYVGISAEDFERMKTELVEKFSKEYHGELIS